MTALRGRLPVAGPSARTAGLTPSDAALLSTPAGTVGIFNPSARLPVLDLTDFKRDLSELTDRLGYAQDCL